MQEEVFWAVAPRSSAKAEARVSGGNPRIAPPQPPLKGTALIRTPSRTFPRKPIGEGLGAGNRLASSLTGGVSASLSVIGEALEILPSPLAKAPPQTADEVANHSIKHPLHTPRNFHGERRKYEFQIGIPGAGPAAALRGGAAAALPGGFHFIPGRGRAGLLPHHRAHGAVRRAAGGAAAAEK